MFTGIVHSKKEIVAVDMDRDYGTIRVRLKSDLIAGLEQGASVAIDGVCLTVSSISEDTATFDVIKSTIQKTNLITKRPGDFVNVERSYRQGDEVGGHEVSGHVDCTANVLSIERLQGNVRQAFSLSPFWMKYLFLEGFIALNGVSLTVAEINKEEGWFAVWLIPETLRRTNLELLKVGDRVNVEVHKGIQVVVDTVGEAVERTINKAIQEGRLTDSLLRDLSQITNRHLHGALIEK
ncbi:MAG: riboflavin synthase subunit alpha [Patescibacteria group bacterium]